MLINSNFWILEQTLEENSTITVCVCQLLSRVRLFATPWTVAHQAPLSMEFFRQEY